MPTLNVDLTKELAEFVSREVASGDYGSASEVMMDALSALRRDRDSEMTDSLRQELALGLEQADRGEFSSRSVQDIAAAVIAEAKGRKSASRRRRRRTSDESSGESLRLSVVTAT